ncbi:hypothetical protein AQUCO_01000481v1 [Aquilegia coerulea]|uniref:Uncharacterized protein n=1 Tax=Aquilegia coerulea TaxID=218851 RepID=A0A2G5EAA3_AQUCA|nr:hypothetical protein AQUCO_01000481v1 [Aquilegia coerulea]
MYNKPSFRYHCCRTTTMHRKSLPHYQYGLSRTVHKIQKSAGCMFSTLLNVETDIQRREPLHFILASKCRD